MVQILPANPKKTRSFADIINGGMNAGADYIGKLSEQKKLEMQREVENAQIQKQFGIDLSGILDPETRKQALVQSLQGKNMLALEQERQKKGMSPLDLARKEAAEQKTSYYKGQSSYLENILGNQMPEQKSQQPNAQQMPQNGEQQPPENMQQREAPEQNGAIDFSKLPETKLKQLAALEKSPGVAGVIGTGAKNELDQRNKTLNKNDQKIAEFRKERMPYIKELISRADVAESSIANKNNLLELIETGNIDDPTYAALAESLPLNLGKRMLSPDTVTYKSGLIDDFGDLKNIFKGATRVKEIELYENKIPDLYLTDDQKKAILKSRINTLSLDIIKAKAAAEVEEEINKQDKPVGLIEFRKRVDEKSKEKMNALADKTIDDIGAVFKDSENRKKIPLNFNDPDDNQIIGQILKEANGDYKKAEKLAKEKGYTW